MTNNISSTLKLLMKNDGVNSSELARHTGIAQPVIYRIASGETDNPKLNTIIPIAKYFNLKVDDLITGIITEKKDSSINKATLEIPLYTWEQIKKKDFTTAILSHATYANISRLAFSFEIEDDSFLPNFPPGAIVTFDPSLSPENGDIVLASYKNEIPSIKKYLVDGGDTYLKPIRPELGAKILDKNETLNILGILTEAISFYRSNPHEKE